MESLYSVAKRKKRKTRKCLDEIRNRSRRNVNDSLLERSPIQNIENKISKYNGIKRNICITSNRLTLTMFPNVIRSETITRPVLSEIAENPVVNFERIIKNVKPTDNEPTNEQKVDEPSQSDSDYIKYSEDNSNSSTYEHFSTGGQMSIHKNSDSGNLSTQDQNSPRSFILFSPEGHREDSDLFEVSPGTSTTSTSSQSSQGSCGYQLYEEFLEEIPMYLRQNTPALIKDDVMQKTKSLLHEIYLESCRQESEENLLNSMRKSVVRKKTFTPTEPEVQSPILDYLHINRVSRPHTEPHHPSMCETPDYTYYPHKLNQ